MRVQFKLRPLTLDIEHETRPRLSRYGVKLPDPLYRRATRRMVTELVRENAALRRDRRRPPRLRSALASAIAVWLRRKGHTV
jgi:hypothetical protein